MRITVIPGLTLDDDLFERAAAGIASYGPQTAPLTWERFVTPANWLNIPNDRGELSKSELTLVNTPERTLRLNVWHRADTRGGDKPMPHNHPWTAFVGCVLAGGYTEDRWRFDAPGDLRADLGVRHASPALNTVTHDVWHEVTEIHDPGRTLSLMVCGSGQRGDWCHLDVETGTTVHGQPVAGFDAMLRALNPQRQP